MKFDGTVTLGALISAATFLLGIIVAYTKGTNWLENRFTKFESTLDSHADQLTGHSSRMDRYEARYVEIANDLQWLVGRMDGDRRRKVSEHKWSQKP